jgi:hypothetical protein
MTPVDLHLLCGLGLKADIGLAVFFRAAAFTQKVPDDGDLSGKAFIAQSLQHHGGFHVRVLFEPLVDQVEVGISFEPRLAGGFLNAGRDFGGTFLRWCDRASGAVRSAVGPAEMD